MDTKELLSSIKQELWQGQSTVEVPVGKWTFTFKTLSESEEVWRDRYVQITPNISFITAKKLPTLAVALTLVDGQPIKNIFLADVLTTTPDPQIDHVLKNLGLSSMEERFILAERVLQFFSEFPREIIDFMYDKYQVLENTKQEAIGEILKKN